MSLYQQVDTLLEKGEYQSLVDLADDNLDKNIDQRTAFRLAYGRAFSLYRLSDFTGAYNNMLDLYGKVENWRIADSLDAITFVDIAQKLGDYSFEASEYKQGIDAIHSGIIVAEKYLPEDYLRLIRLYLKLVPLNRVKGEFDDAFEAHKEVENILALMDEEDAREIRSTVLSEKAQLYNDQNKLSEAIEIYQKILALAYADSNLLRIGVYNNNIAIAYYRKNNFGLSEYHLRKSLEAEIQNSGEKSPKIISSYNNLGVINTRLERHKIAGEYFQKNADLVKELFGTDHPRYSDNLYNVGMSHFIRQNYEEAKDFFSRVLDMRSKREDQTKQILAETYGMLGASLVKLENYDEAEPLLSKAMEIRQDIGVTFGNDARGVLVDLAQISFYRKEVDKYYEYLDQSFNAAGYDSQNPYDFSKVQTPIGLAETVDVAYRKYIDSYKDSRNPDLLTKALALDMVVDSLRQHIRLTYHDSESRRVLIGGLKPLIENKIYFYTTRLEETSDEEWLDQAFQAFENNNNTFLYECIVESTGSSFLGVPEEIINKKNSLIDSIQFYENNISNTDKNIESKKYQILLSRLNNHKDDYLDLIKQLKISYPKYYQAIYSFPTISRREYANQLDPNEISISYFVGSNEVYGLAITSSQCQLINLGEAKLVKDLVTSFLELVKNRNQPDAYVEKSKQLYKLLLSPFLLDAYDHIYLITDDILGILPFGLLTDEKTDITLFKDKVITYKYAASITDRDPDQSFEDEILAMAPVFESLKNEEPEFAGNMAGTDVFRDDIVYLPETINELTSIASLIDGEYLYKNQATEANFKAKAPGARIIHLATHGYVNHDNADRSRLYFSAGEESAEDGILHAFEIVNMDLNADLVTLSACNTGVGAIQRGEGVASLGRSFAYAGANNQLISLWPANDKSTTMLMNYFYENLMAGQGKSTALHNAKLTYLENVPKVYRHPYYWAGFVYYGADTPLIIEGNNQFFFYLFGGLLLLAGIIFLWKKV